MRRASCRSVPMTCSPPSALTRSSSATCLRKAVHGVAVEVVALGVDCVAARCAISANDEPIGRDVVLAQHAVDLGHGLFVQFAAQLDVDATTGHVGGDGHRADLAGAGDDARFLCVMARIEHAVRHAALQRLPEARGLVQAEQVGQLGQVLLVGWDRSRCPTRRLACAVARPRASPAARSGRCMLSAIGAHCRPRVLFRCCRSRVTLAQRRTMVPSSRLLRCSETATEVVPTRMGRPRQCWVTMSWTTARNLPSSVRRTTSARSSRARPVGGQDEDVQFIDFLKLFGFCRRRTGHPGQLFVHPEIVLQGDRGIGNVFLADLDAFFGLHGLVQAVRPAAPGHGAPGELVHDDHALALDDVVAVSLHDVLGLERLFEVVEQLGLLGRHLFGVFGIKERLPKQLLDVVIAGIGQRDAPRSHVDLVILGRQLA